MGNIYLVGFMGTGKTVVGKEISRLRKQQFIDLDSLIESRQKKEIRHIFSEQGESYFRTLEKQALEEVAAQDGKVVSCGGGIVKDEGNIKLMKQTGAMICLNARPEVILRRTSGHAHRPLLNV